MLPGIAGVVLTVIEMELEVELPHALLTAHVNDPVANATYCDSVAPEMLPPFNAH